MICRKTISELIELGENEQIEFKSTLAERKKILITITALANTKGGVILVGIQDNGDVLGIDLGNSTVEQLVNQITNRIEPKILPEISIVEYKGKIVMKLCIQEGTQKPYAFDGTVYKRVGKTNIKAGATEIRKLLSTEKLSFDNSISRISVNDLSDELIKRYITLAKETRNIEMNYTSKSDFLDRLGLVRGSNVKNAAVLLFYRDPTKEIPHAYIKCGYFEDENVIDYVDIKSDIITQIEESLDFIKKYIKISMKKTNNRKIDNWEIPRDAIREALVNAIAHRDYLIPGPIQVKITESKLAIINPGGLISELTVDKLYKQHPSIPRNQIIADMLFKVGYFESWGSGTNTIISLCKNANKSVLFRDRKAFFETIFWIVPLNDRQLQFLGYENGLTIKEYTKQFNVSERTARLDIKQLQDIGEIRKIKNGVIKYIPL